MQIGRIFSKVNVSFSEKEQVFYFFLFCFLLFHHAEIWKKPQFVAIDIGFILLFMLFNKLRFFLTLAFLIYGALEKMSRFPTLANHSNLFLLMCVFLFFHLMLKTFKLERDVSIWKTLKWLLIVTYFYAGFHKLNFDFLLNTEVSCSKWYIEKLLRPFFDNFTLDNSFLTIFLSVSVLVVEIGGAFLLMFRKTQYIGLILALMLHATLSPGGFVDFASLALALMIAFVPTQLFHHKKIEKIIKSYGLLSIAYACLTGILVFADGGSARRPLQGFVFIATVIFILYILLSKTKKSDFYPTVLAKEKMGRLGLATVLFLTVFASQNYLGLSTAGTLSMFSNLVTERGSKTNHLLLKTNPFKIFPLQDDIVWVQGVSPIHLDSFRKGWKFTGYGVPLIEFKRSLYRERNRRSYDNLRIDFIYKGEYYSVHNITSNTKWTPKKRSWKMMLFQFRRVPKEGRPVYCRW